MQNYLFCKICNKENDDPKHFWKIHKVTQANYFLQYYNRRDLLTSEPIPFKDIDSYFSTDFINKNNFNKWFKLQSVEVQQKYCKELLSRRKEQKNLIWSLSQVELRSLKMPGMGVYNKLFQNYYLLCEKLGFQNKFSGDYDNITLNSSFNKYVVTETDYMIIDSRESRPLKFDIPILVKKLEVADYCFSANPCLVFERKSINDFYSTLTSGLNRFKNELNKSKELGLFVVIIVEGDLSKIASFPHIPYFKTKVRASSDFVFHNMRELIQSYDNLQFLFVGGRREMSRVILTISRSHNLYKSHDLQFLYDFKQI